MTSKPMVVSLAILGAILTTFARALSSIVVSLIGDRRFESRDLAINLIAKGLSTSGYVAMSVSIFLFIVSGFIIIYIWFYCVYFLSTFFIPKKIYD